MTPSQFAKELVTKTLRNGDEYEDYTLSKILIDGLDASVDYRMREYLWNWKDANQRDFSYYATSSFLLQGYDVAPKRTNPTVPKPQNQLGKLS